MNWRKSKKIIGLIIPTVIFLTGLGINSCSAPLTESPSITPLDSQISDSSPTATPSPTLPPTLTPTLSPTPFFLTITAWKGNLQAPVILYHRFLPDSYDHSTSTKLRLGDFQSQLQAFYDSGYSLVGLEDWLMGDIQIPPGRRPLIFTMDDAFFADQIYLENGRPSLRSGLGVLWKFSQDHPDFGFNISLFYNLGDKLYGNVLTPIWFQNGPGWEDSLAEVIVWCIENNASPFNHFYDHPRLDLSTGSEIVWEMQENDKILRDYLNRAGRNDLIPHLGNIMALPYGLWPQGVPAQQLVIDYLNPEGKPVLAVLEGNIYYDKKYLQLPSMPGYDRIHIPRLPISEQTVDLLTTLPDLFPIAKQCQIGPLDPEKMNNLAYLSQAIQESVAAGSCPVGTYQLNHLLFIAQDGIIHPIISHP